MFDDDVSQIIDIEGIEQYEHKIDSALRSKLFFNFLDFKPAWICQHNNAKINILPKDLY